MHLPAEESFLFGVLGQAPRGQGRLGDLTQTLGRAPTLPCCRLARRALRRILPTGLLAGAAGVAGSGGGGAKKQRAVPVPNWLL